MKINETNRNTALLHMSFTRNRYGDGVWGSKALRKNILFKIIFDLLLQSSTMLTSFFVVVVVTAADIDADVEDVCDRCSFKIYIYSMNKLKSLK